MQKRQEIMPQPLLLNISQVTKLLGLGRTKVYELIAHEGLPVVYFGRAVRVPYTSLQHWLTQREQSLSAHELRNEMEGTLSRVLEAQGMPSGTW